MPSRHVRRSGAAQAAGWRRAAASAASVSIRAQSPCATASFGVSHDPPTQPTLSRASHCAALAAVMPLGERIRPLLHASEVRTVAADELWLSPAHRRDSACVHFTWKQRPEEVAALLPAIEERLAPFAPRPHWGKVFTTVLAGGGVKGGAVYGASDRYAAEPSVNPTSPADLAATVYHLLGVDPRTEIRDRLGRPLTLRDGRVIGDILS